MTYPQVRIKFYDENPIPKPLDGETNSSLNRATYYPSRWEVIDNEVLVLIWNLDEVDTDNYSLHPVRGSDDTHRLYIPLANVQYWTASN